MSNALLVKFVALRRKLLQAEIETARLVGRSEDAGKAEAELRCLDACPTDALMTRVATGRLVSGRAKLATTDFEAQENSARRRLVELEAEVKEWRATRATSRSRSR